MQASIVRRPFSLKLRLLSDLGPRCSYLSSLMVLGTTVGVLGIAAPQKAEAWSIYDGSYNDQQVAISLNTTVEYSNLYRVNDPSAFLTNNVNGDEGDRNFRHGWGSNEFEVLPIFDVKYGDFGFHVSGEAYLNTVYLQQNKNNSPSTINPISISRNTDFTSATRNVNGENAKLLDAFVYGSKYFGADSGQEVTVKFGRQTLLWGQSLLFASDGISAGQAPIDVQVAQTTPNALAQQVFLPVGQGVLTYQPNQTLTFQGYYQFEWAPDNFEGVGSYFSSADILDKGGQRLLLGTTNAGPALYRIKDNRPPVDNGQFGVSVQAQIGNYDTGLFIERYDAKAPEIYDGAPAKSASTSPANVGSYWLVYPTAIQLYGASLSTTVGPVNVAGEFSYRRNAPLDSGLGSSISYPGSANAGALFAKGQVVNGQVSALYVSPPLPFDPGGLSVDAEYVMNSVVAIDDNRSALVPGRNATAGAAQFIITPTYFFTHIPNVQFNFPIGMEMGLFNRSQFDGSINHGVGSFNCGITAIYRATYTAGLVYQDYIGRASSGLQPTADRGYVGFNLEHTF